MKYRIVIPPVAYKYTDTSWIYKDLTSLRNHRQQDKRNKRTGNPTFCGIYKSLRTNPKYAAFGDYVLLSCAVAWAKNEKYPLDAQEIKRCISRHSDELKRQRWVVNDLLKEWFYDS